MEKELAAEIESLDKRKDELEAELKKVTTSLASARARLHNAREERDQFHEASNQIIQHFKVKEDELSKSIASYSAEAEVCNTFVSFLENTWSFQSSCAEQKEKIVNDELERHENYFADLALSLLAAYKEELVPSISATRELIENVKRLDETAATQEDTDAFDSRRSLEEQFKNLEIMFLSTFNVVENIREQFEDKDSRKKYEKVKELLDALEKIKEEFESIEKPTFETEAPNTREEPIAKPRTPRTPRIPFLSPRQPPKEKVEFNNEPASANEAQRGVSLTTFSPMITLPLVRSRTTNDKSDTESIGTNDKSDTESIGVNGKKGASDAEVQLSKLKVELELENHSRTSSMDGIIDWEFDDHFDKEPNKSF